MLNLYANVGLFVIIFAAILGTIYYFKYKNTPFKYLLFALWLIVVIEILGRFHKELHIYYMDDSGQKYNLHLYNLLSFVIFPGYLLMYYKILKTNKFRFVVKIFAITFMLFAIINWIFIQNFFTEYVNYPRIVGSLFLTISIIFYFIELLRSDRIVSFQRSVPFWISVGLLVYYTSTIPFTVVQNSYMFSSKEAILNIFIMKNILSIAMYLIFSFGFVWSRKE